MFVKSSKFGIKHSSVVGCTRLRYLVYRHVYIPTSVHKNKYQGVFVKHGVCPRRQQSQAIFSVKVKVIDLGVI